MHLAYFADPLCSWCYGFGPELSRLVASRPDTRLDLVMGGLRPFNREPMSDAFRAMLREHWAHVAQASGLAFSEAVLDAPGFTYDTEPACRAVVAARSLDPARALDCMQAIQRGFYAGGMDMTSPGALADAAAATGYDRPGFLDRLESPAMREATRADFSLAQSTGVTGFPTLALRRDAGLYLVTSGFATADVLAARVAEIERRTAAPA